jgi:hypothetical protein
MAYHGAIQAELERERVARNEARKKEAADKDVYELNLHLEDFVCGSMTSTTLDKELSKLMSSDTFRDLEIKIFWVYWTVFGCATLFVAGFLISAEVDGDTPDPGDLCTLGWVTVYQWGAWSCFTWGLLLIWGLYFAASSLLTFRTQLPLLVKAWRHNEQETEDSRSTHEQVVWDFAKDLWHHVRFRAIAVLVLLAWSLSWWAVGIALWGLAESKDCPQKTINYVGCGVIIQMPLFLAYVIAMAAGSLAVWDADSKCFPCLHYKHHYGVLRDSDAYKDVKDRARKLAVSAKATGKKTLASAKAGGKKGLAIAAAGGKKGFRNAVAGGKRGLAAANNVKKPWPQHGNKAKDGVD